MAHSSSTSYSESLAELDRAVAVLDADGDDAALAEAHHARSTILFFAGRTNDAKVAAKRAVEYARRAENLHLEVLAAEAFGAAIAWSDTPWAEVDRYTRSKLADTRLGPRAHARALRGIALGLWARERFAEARRVFADAHSRLEALGLRLHAAAHPTAVAHMEWAAGDIEAMEYNARDSWVRLGELGEAGYRATAGVMLAEALVRLGHTREAETILSEAEQLASPDDYATAHAALAVRALLAASAGSHEEAIDLAEQSLSVVNRTDATEHQIAAQIRAAEVFVAAGRNNEAGALIAQATERANRKGNTALAARARRVLQPLMQAGASSSGKAVRPPES
jgi:tetratricopeptide (TPR) repeat protein